MYRSKIFKFFKNVWLDYSEVFKDAKTKVRKSPVKASCYGMASLFVLNMFRTNEGLRSYSAEVVSACNRVGSVVEKCRNPISGQFVQNIGELNCHRLLRQIDLGFSTLIYKADSNPELALYRYNCPYMKPTLREFFLERLVDLGVLGHWFNLEYKMKDYDINENEYDPTIINSSLSSQSEER